MPPRQFLPVIIGALSILCVDATAVSESFSTTHALLEPREANHSAIGYVTSIPLNIIALVLILLIAASQTLLTRKWGPKWMLSLVIGEYCFAFGFILRFGVHVNNTVALYAIENLFIILAPCAFIAADYVLLGRLARHLEAERHLLVNPQKITKYFVTSDVVTFLIQASGGGLSASPAQSTLGSRIFLTGLILQLISFTIFSVIYGTFLYRVYTQDPQIWSQDDSKKKTDDWRALAGALCISCLGILIRSFYRVIELSEGYRGYLATSEGYFYGLDTLPLLVAISIFTPFWPGRFIKSSNHYTSNDSNTIELNGGISGEPKSDGA
ncbi:hypothetical protein H0H92_002459 [Tricholoma furcatifolium]|nr:hypothetical protein H0H92_002459 [Tricholoma furcatifolium]